MDYSNIFVIILAAGKGSRFHEKKQFFEFHGKQLWQHVVDTASELLPRSNICVVGVDIQGGDSRSESVKKGLEEVSRRGQCSKVIILEAARCLVSKKQLKRVFETEGDSISFVNPVVDTIILKDFTYLSRSECLSLVSPQAFNFSKLFSAYQKADLSEKRTDETRLMYERYGIRPTLIEGADNLFKVTYPKDIFVLEEIYKQMIDNGEY